MLSQISIDELFDLDMALTAQANSSHLLDSHPTAAAEAAAAHQLVEDMPTVAAGGGGGCTICMEGFATDASGKQVPCGHVFHSNCIARWLSHHNSCPLCRSRIPPPAAAAEKLVL